MGRSCVRRNHECTGFARRFLLLGVLVLKVSAFDVRISNLFPHAEMKYATEELDDNTFQTWVDDHPVTAILFYAPWCEFSQRVLPAWEIASQKLMLDDPPVHLAKIDASRFRAVGDRYEVDAFPILKLFSEGAVFEYDAPPERRSWQQLVKWVNKHTGRDHILKSVEDVDHYLHDNDLNVIGVFPDGNTNTVFGHSALHYEDVVFAEAQGTEIATTVAEHLSRHATLVCETVDIGHTKVGKLPRMNMHCSNQPRNPQRSEWGDKFHAEVDGLKVTVKRTDSTDGWQQMLQLKCCDDENNAEIKEKHHVPVPSIVMFMPHDERFAIYDGDFNDIHAIDKFITAGRTPMVMKLDASAARMIFGSGDGTEKLPVLFLFKSAEEPAIEKIIRGAVKKLRGRVLVCFSTFESPVEQGLADVVGVDMEQAPVIMMVETLPPTRTAKTYRLSTQGLTEQAVETFVTSYEAGTLKPWLKSERAEL